uniref:Protease inhibitor n=1 Tax=Oncocephalus sp. TaxID=2944721 RepID=A0AB38ZEW4_9HEMI
MKFAVILLLTGLTIAVVSAGKKCDKPGEKFDDGCNRCKCTKGGMLACTKRLCQSKKVKREAKECVPGTTWNDGCNLCTCSDDGLALCTRMGCK